jgi:hypothetical protein
MRSFRFRPVRAGRYLLLAGVLSLLAAQAFGAGSAIAADTIVCYSVADQGGSGGGQDDAGQDLLTRIDPDDSNPATNETTIGTGTGTFRVEAAAFQPGTEVLFALDGGQLGTVSLTTGVFSAKASPVGTGSGSAGDVAFDNIDGLTFDPSDGTLYGSHRIAGDAPDVLLIINPSTGAHVPNAFGQGDDYIQITPLPDQAKIDDLAIADNGTMYAIANVGGHADQLVTINPDTGALTDIGATGTDDVEGLTIAPDGRMFGSTGNEGAIDGGAIWDIDPDTGVASNGRPLDNTRDYESISCIAEAGAPSPSPSPSVIPTETETAGPAPTVSATVEGVKVIAETGSSAVPGLILLGLMSLSAGVAMLWIASGKEEAIPR